MRIALRTLSIVLIRARFRYRNFNYLFLTLRVLLMKIASVQSLWTALGLLYRK